MPVIEASRLQCSRIAVQSRIELTKDGETRLGNARNSAFLRVAEAFRVQTASPVKIQLWKGR